MILSQSKLLAFLAAVWLLLVPSLSAAEPPLLLPEFSSTSNEIGGGENGNGFVAVGELQRIRRDDGTRRLAILNESGEIAAFLAPSARVNMRQYVGQQVAVTARSVTQTDGQAPLIIPGRVTPMTARRQLAATSASPNSSTARGAIGSGVRANGVRDSGVRQASFDGHVDAGIPSDAIIVDDTGYEDWEVLGEDGTAFDGAAFDGIVDGGCADGSCGAVSGGCASCGFQCGGGCGGGSICGPWGRIFVRAEYINWWAKGMDVPALVTTSDAGTSRNNAGVLGRDTTDVIYGQNDILDGSRSGVRIRFGGFLGPCRRLGWEMEYFGLGDLNENFEARSNGNGEPILARPFFNMNPRVGGGGTFNPPPGEDAEIVSFPGVLSGVVTVESQSRLDSAAGRLRWNFCCKKLACGNQCCGCGPPQGFSRVDVTAGYRYLDLDDRIRITEDLTSLQAQNPGRFQLFDQFETENEFHGGEVGFMWEGGWRNWTLEVLSRIALGNVHQTVVIGGETTISPLTQPQQTFDGGLLTQRTNIGEYSRDEFGMLNELGMTLGLYITPRLRATVGYTFLYLSPVVRAGDQIDLDVNPDLIPPEIQPFAGPERPQFVFRETDFWANGLNVGLDLRW